MDQLNIETIVGFRRRNRHAMRLAATASLGALSLGTLCGSTAVAQTTTTQTATTQTALPQTASASTADAQASVEEVIVTAQKRSQNILDVPISMQALSSKKLADEGITQLGQLQELVPNFQVSDADSTRTIYIRGVGGGGRTVGFDTRTGVYLDGVYIGQTMAADALLTNLDRVEVLRGPQGYLYGESTDSGAINLVTRPPADVTEGALTTSYGNKNDVRVVANLNTPIVDDKVLFRAGVAYEDRDGFTYDPTLHKYVDDLDNYGGRAQLRLLPLTNLTIDLTADYSHQLSHDVNGQARTNTFGYGPPAGGLVPFVSDDNTPQLDLNRNWGLSATVNYKLDNLTFTSVTGYRNAFRNWNVDVDHSALDLLSFKYYDYYSTISQEFRVANADSGNIHYVFGAFFLNTHGNNNRTSTFGSDAPTYLATPDGAYIHTNPSVNNSSYSLFGAADYQILSRLTLNTGLRINWEQKSLLLNQFSDAPVYVSDIANITGYKNHIYETSVSPEIGLTWKPATDTMVYAKYARGVKSGGFNADYLTTDELRTNLRLLPETVDNYEIGSKYQTKNRTLTLMGDIFYALYSNYQVSQFYLIPGTNPPEVDTALTNAGKVETYGPELSALIAPFKGFTADLNFAYLSAIYKSFPDGGGIGVNYSGHQLEYAPKETGSVTFNYSHVVSSDYVGFGLVNISYHGPEFSDPSNDPQFFQKSYTLVNARLGIKMPGNHWQVTLYADNLFNKLYDLGTSVDAFGTIFGKYGTPRTFGAELGGRF